MSCTYEHLEKAANSSCTNTTLALTYSFTQPSTCSSTDGSLTLRASGGLSKYSFKLNNGSFSVDTLYSNLSQGNYNVTVKDSAGCTLSKIISLNSKSTDIQVSVVTTTDSNCSNNGSITVNVTGGKKPFMYSINSGAAQASNVFKGLAAATYSINVTDSTNCQASSSAIVASAGPSFTNDIQPIISSNCATVGCHDGSRSPNLSAYSGISSNGSSVVGAINNNMPPGGRLTAQQISLITCWVKSGTPNN
jgi:hypothetical protein